MDINTNLVENFIAIMPEVLMAVLALAVVYLDLYLPPTQRRTIGYVAGIGMLAIAALALFIPTPSDFNEQLMWGGTIRNDDLAKIFRVTVILIGGLTCFMGMGDNRLRYKSEFYTILIIATIGASLLSAASDIIMLFVALETMSISLYILSGFVRLPQFPTPEEKRFANLSAESGVKYFLFGSFTSAFLLYGLSLLYGFSGGYTNLYEIGPGLVGGEHPTAPIIVALGLVAVGFGFKVSAVPFHFWTPDVYEGSPTPVTSFISVASKAASFAVLTRFMLAVFPPEQLLPEGIQSISYSEWWVQLFAIAAVLTMTIGNLLALVQTNFKRLIAYSSIAQAGYTLIGLVAIATGNNAGDGAAAVAFYMVIYAFTNTLLFGCLILFTNQTGSEMIADMAGLSRRNPWLALGLTVALLSLAGIPPAAGFFGKFLLFRAAVDANLTWLAVVGVLNSIVALYYYLVVIKVMYVDRSAEDNLPIPIAVPYNFVLAATAVFVILLGVLPALVVNLATEAGADLFFLP
ncbi:MAG: NADH-quinone oxidoreductase subunit N [Phototrophicales bacterium]|nr:MAG: NADH-quinone oxidoreductase subunit N [Phototrophicales bacterium]